MKLQLFPQDFQPESDIEDNKTMKNTIRPLIIQWIAFGLIWNPAFAQETGSATQDIADRYKYKDYIHQSTIDKYEEECEKLEHKCNPNTPTDRGIDVVNSFIAQHAMGFLVAGGLGSALSLKAGSLRRSVNVDKARKNLTKQKSLLKKSQKQHKSLIKEGAKTEDLNRAAESLKTNEANLDKAQAKMDKAKADPDKEGGADLGKICKLVATAGVMGLSLSTMLSQNKMQKKYNKTSMEIAQSEALYTIANNHELKRKSNVTQGTIFGTVATCFGVASAIEFSKYNIPKGIEYAVYTGLAGTLSTLSLKSAKRHKETRDEALTAARKIPKKGECYPGTPCFCAEQREVSEAAHSLEFEQNCIADELQRGDSTHIGMACLDGRGQADPTCECRANNTCLDNALNFEIRNMDLDPGIESNLTDSFSIIARGELSAADRNKIGKRADYFSKLAEKQTNKALAGQNLKAGDPKLAKAYRAAGMSPATALLASQAKLTPKHKKRLTQVTGRTVAKSYTRRGKKTRKRRTTVSKLPSFDFSSNDIFKKLQGQEKEASMDPAERLREYKRRRAQRRAVAMAEINPLENEPIFNIISQRYLKSGLIKLDN